MKQFKKILLVLLLVLSLSLVAACEKEKEPVKEPESPFDVLPTDIDHYYSNQVRFSDMNLEVSDRFMEDKIAKLTLKSVTDGDTAVFYLSGGETDSYTNSMNKSYGYLTVRFLSIDTPESTSSIAPWGKKASAYAKSLLENAEGIIVDATSIDTSDKSVYPTTTSTFVGGCRLDSNGTRWLANIWYCPKGGNPDNYAEYRSYQLDMIEECYSFYTGNANDTQFVYQANEIIEPKLYERYQEVNGEKRFGSLTLADVMLEADIRMQTLKLRKSGSQIDPNYDYSKTPTAYSITQAVAQYEELSKENKFVELTGVITAFIGANFYFQDAEGTPLYVYMGIDAKNIGQMFKVGDTIKIRGRLSEYGGQIQLTDIVWSKDTFIKVTGDGAIPMPEPIEINPSGLTSDYLDQYLGKLITVTLNTKTAGNVSKDGSYSVYSSHTISGKVSSYNTLDIRINGTLHPGYPSDEFHTYFNNSTVTVTGVMATYLETDLTASINYPSYQIVVGNRTIDENGDILFNIVKK